MPISMNHTNLHRPQDYSYIYHIDQLQLHYRPGVESQPSKLRFQPNEIHHRQVYLIDIQYIANPFHLIQVQLLR
jgi:hypothetical protein